MGWVGWTIISIIVIGSICTMAIMKVASDADDRMMGDLQYYDNTRT
jgi:hypothetical protein